MHVHTPGTPANVLHALIESFTVMISNEEFHTLDYFVLGAALDYHQLYRMVKIILVHRNNYYDS